MSQQLGLKSRRVEAPNSLDAINDLYYQRGWTDGLPIVPPTEERVWKMLQASPKDPARVLGKLPPADGTVTVEKVAINAVMAGCQPDYLPVVMAATQAVCREEFNAGGVQTTTGGSIPLIIINGPLAGQLNVNADMSAFGHGGRANATMGRALRLVMRNVGRAIPGETDMSTMGHPGKYTMCIAENEARSPWEPLHVERGCLSEVSTVTVVAVTGFLQLNEETSISGREVLNTFCDSLTIPAAFLYYIIGRRKPLLLVLGPEHAAEMAAEGFSKEDVKSYIFEHARMSLGRMRNRGNHVAIIFQVDPVGKGMAAPVPPVAHTPQGHHDCGGGRPRQAFGLALHLPGQQIGHPSRRYGGVAKQRLSPVQDVSGPTRRNWPLQRPA